MGGLAVRATCAQYQTLRHREQLLRAPLSASTPQAGKERAALMRMHARVRGEGSAMPAPLATKSSTQRVYRRVANSAGGQCTSFSAARARGGEAGELTWQQGRQAGSRLFVRLFVRKGDL